MIFKCKCLKRFHKISELFNYEKEMKWFCPRETKLIKAVTGWGKPLAQIILHLN